MRWQPFFFAAVLACRLPVDPAAPVTQEPLPLPETSIRGTITDARTDLPIPTALFGVALGTSSGLAATMPVDANGQFVVSDVIPGGNYGLVASAAGYQSSNVYVLSVRDAVVRADIRLNPAPVQVGITPTTLELGLASTSSTFQLSNTGATTATFKVVAPAAWVTRVTPAEGTLPSNSMQSIAIEVDRSLISGFGAHSTLLTVLFEGGARFVEVRVRNVNENAPQLSYDVAALDFGTASATRSFEVTNVGTGSLHWSIASGVPSWLSFEPRSGTVTAGARSTVVATVNRTGLPPSSLLDTYFMVDSDSVVDTVLPIRAHLETPGASGWTLNPPSLALPTGTVSDVVTLANTGTLPLDWAAEAVGSLIGASPSSGRLLPGASTRIYVGVEVSSRAAGPFSETLNIVSSLGTLPLSVTGTRVIVPLLEVPPQVEVTVDGRGTASSSAWVNNVGEGSIAWSASTTTPWISLTTQSGTSSAGLSCVFASGACGTPLRFSVNLDAMEDGSTSTGTIKVTQIAGGQTSTITVKGRVRLAPFHWDTARPTTPAQLSRTLLSTAIYDPVRDRVVLFGGGNPQPNTEYSDCTNRTWEFDGVQWREVTTANAPPPCNQAPMVFDRRRGVVVWTDTGSYGTWEYDGVDWTKITGAAQTTYTYTLPSWSPKLRQVVMVDWGGTDAQLVGWRDGTWHDLGAGPPYTPGWRFLNTSEAQWMQLPNGQSYLVDQVEGEPIYTAQFGSPVRALSGGVGFDPLKYWLYGVSSSYVDGGDVSSRGHLLGSNLRTGESIDQPLPADFGKRVGHAVAVDTARQRILIVGGTYCDYATCADYGRALPTAFLNFNPPGVTHSEHPSLSVSTQTLDFGTSAQTLSITLSNGADGELDYSGELPAGFTGDIPFAPVLQGGSVTIPITVNRAAFSSGPHTIPWKLRSDGGNTVINLQFTSP